MGLLGFELLLALYAVLSVPLSVALVVALRRANQSLLAIFLALGIIGAVAFVAARPALEMLSLSNQYATAPTEAERAAFLAAGEGLVAVFHGTAFYTSYILGSIAGLVISSGAVAFEEKISSEVRAVRSEGDPVIPVRETQPGDSS